MGETPQQIRRRLRYLTPDNAGKILGNPRYWNMLFFEHYLKHAEAASYEDVTEGFLYALHAPGLARRIPIEDPREHGGAETGQASLQLTGLGMLGWCALRADETTKAQASFAEGLLLLQCTPILPRAELGFLWRYAVYQLGTCGEATATLRQANSLLDEGGMQLQDLISLELVKARVLMPHRRGGQELGKAARLMPYRSRYARQVLIACLQAVRDYQIIQPDQELILHTLRRFHKQYRTKLSFFEQSMLAWIDGLVVERAGSHRIALKRYQWAMKFANRLEHAHRAGALLEDLRRVENER